MTDEEINNLAVKHCNEVLCNAHEKCNEVIKCRDWRLRRAGFFCGYEQAIKDMQQEYNKLLDVINNQDVKIADLEKQIEKMKCCGNCKQRELIREHGQWKERFNCKGNGCVCYNKWRLKND